MGLIGCQEALATVVLTGPELILGICTPLDYISVVFLSQIETAPPADLQRSAPRLPVFRPQVYRVPPPVIESPALLLCPLIVQFRPYWCPIKTSVPPLLVGE